MKLKLLNTKKDINEIQELWKLPYFLSDLSYFLSWGWIENWISSLPSDVDLKLAVLEKTNPVAIFFLGTNKVYRKKSLFRWRAFFINATGHEVYDIPLWIEYNSIPCTSDGPTIDDIINVLPDNWDEIVLPGLNANHFPGNSLIRSLWTDDIGYRIIIDRDIPSYYVDLEHVRNNKRDYIGLLSRNTRAQIRRTYRLYQLKGEIQLENASTHGRAFEMFEEMFQMHKDRYSRMKKKSNFATPFSYNFHENLIKNRFHSGEIQLLRITTGSQILGILYNFVFKGKVLFFQSGLKWETDNRLKPSYICHTEAIKYNASLNYSIYDFLAGKEQYKSSLATNNNRLIWVKIVKPMRKFGIEEKLIDILKRLKMLTGIVFRN